MASPPQSGYSPSIELLDADDESHATMGPKPRSPVRELAMGIEEYKGDTVGTVWCVSPPPERGAAASVTAARAEAEDVARALRMAAFDGKLEAVDQLCAELSAEQLDAEDAQAWTALMYACRGGHMAIAKVLVERGANINAANQRGWTPLMFASWLPQPQEELVQFLLGAAADASARNTAGLSCADEARSQHNEAVAALLDAQSGRGSANPEHVAQTPPRPGQQGRRSSRASSGPRKRAAPGRVVKVAAEERQRALRDVPVLQALSAAERRRLARLVEVRAYGEGEAIVRQGDEGGAMYVLLQGSAEADVDGVMTQEYSEGGSFGEMALLTSERRRATVVATSARAVCACLHRKQFDMVVGKLGGCMAELRRRLRANAFRDGKADYERLFQHYDRDNSGELSWEQFRSAARRDGQVTTRAVPDRQLRILFDMIDLSGTGNLALEEFHLFLSSSKHSETPWTPSTAPRRRKSGAGETSQRGSSGGQSVEQSWQQEQELELELTQGQQGSEAAREQARLPAQVAPAQWSAEEQQQDAAEAATRLRAAIAAGDASAVAASAAAVRASSSSLIERVAGAGMATQPAVSDDTPAPSQAPEDGRHEPPSALPQTPPATPTGPPPGFPTTESDEERPATGGAGRPQWPRSPGERSRTVRMRQQSIRLERDNERLAAELRDTMAALAVSKQEAATMTRRLRQAGREAAANAERAAQAEQARAICEGERDAATNMARSATDQLSLMQRQVAGHRHPGTRMDTELEQLQQKWREQQMRHERAETSGGVAPGRAPSPGGSSVESVGLIEVLCPDSVRPGELITVEIAEDGDGDGITTLEVEVPSGVGPGEKFLVDERRELGRVETLPAALEETAAATVEAAEARADEAERQLDEVMAQVGAVLARQKRDEARISELEAQLSESTPDDVAPARSSSAVEHVEVDALKEDLEVVRALLAAAEEKNVALTATAAETDQAASSAEREADALRQELAVARSSLATVEAEKQATADAEGVAEALKRELEAVRSLLAAAEADKKALAAAAKGAEDQAGKLQNEVNASAAHLRQALNEQAAAAQEVRAAAEAARGAEADEIAELKAALALSEQKVVAVVTESAEAVVAARAEEAALAVVSARRDAEATLAEAVAAAVAEERRRAADAQQAQAIAAANDAGAVEEGLRAELAALRRDLQQAEGTATDNAAMLEEAEAELKDAQESAKLKAQELSALREQVAELERAPANTEEQEQLHAELREEQKGRRAAEDQLKAARAEAEGLAAQLKGAQAAEATRAAEAAELAQNVRVMLTPARKEAASDTEGATTPRQLFASEESEAWSASRSPMNEPPGDEAQGPARTYSEEVQEMVKDRVEALEAELDESRAREEHQEAAAMRATEQAEQERRQRLAAEQARKALEAQLQAETAGRERSSREEVTNLEQEVASLRERLQREIAVANEGSAQASELAQNVRVMLTPAKSAPVPEPEPEPELRVEGTDQNPFEGGVSSFGDAEQTGAENPFASSSDEEEDPFAVAPPPLRPGAKSPYSSPQSPVSTMASVLEESMESESESDSESGHDGDVDVPAELLMEPAAPPLPSRHQFVGIMRHSARVDNPEDFAKADPADPRCAWDDRQARPFDTPICDFALPHAQAQALREHGFTRVVSSPFRRCLQTAGIVAAALGVRTVDVHLGLGEAMAQVKRNGWPDDPGHELTYLSKAEMEAAVQAAPGATGSALRLGAVRGEKPRFGQDDVQRIRSVLGQMCAEVVSDSGGVLMVTHGDVLAQWVEMATRETVLQCDYCGFIASRRTDGGSAASPTPADFERVAAEGVMSMFLS